MVLLWGKDFPNGAKQKISRNYTCDCISDFRAVYHWNCKILTSGGSRLFLSSQKYKPILPSPGAAYWNFLSKITAPPPESTVASIALFQNYWPIKLAAWYTQVGKLDNINNHQVHILSFSVSSLNFFVSFLNFQFCFCKDKHSYLEITAEAEKCFGIFSSTCRGSPIVIRIAGNFRQVST